MSTETRRVLGALGVLSGLSAVGVVLKATGLFGGSWWAVTAPLWAPPLAFIVVGYVTTVAYNTVQRLKEGARSEA